MPAVLKPAKRFHPLPSYWSLAPGALPWIRGKIDWLM